MWTAAYWPAAYWPRAYWPDAEGGDTAPPAALDVGGGVPLWALRREAKLRERERRAEARAKARAAARPAVRKPVAPPPPAVPILGGAFAPLAAAPVDVPLPPARAGIPNADPTAENQDAEDALVAVLLGA